jgi:hypothetical protein
VPETASDAQGDAVQPRRELLGLAQDSRLADQDQKGRLESILGLGTLGQQPLAHCQDHGSMPLHQDGKSLRIAAVGKALQQLGIRTVVATAQRTAASKSV